MDYAELRIAEIPVLVRDHAVDKLREAIAAGFYPPGARLVERELCEALGVSRTSVREALRLLQAENLIEVGPRRSITVTIVSARDAEDIYTLRETIESIAIRRFVERKDPVAHKSLTTIWKSLQKAIGKDDLPTLAALAGRFYETILKGSGSKVIHDTGSLLLKRVSYLRLSAMAQPGRLNGGVEEWNAIMAAVQNEDPKAAAAALAHHIRNSRTAIVALVTRQEADAPHR